MSGGNKPLTGESRERAERAEREREEKDYNTHLADISSGSARAVQFLNNLWVTL